MCGPETKVSSAHSVPKAGYHTLTSMVKWARWETPGNACRNWRLVRVGPYVGHTLVSGAVGSPHLLLLWRDYGLKRSCPLPKDNPWVMGSQNEVSDSPFILVHLQPPLSWNCILFPTQQPVSVPPQSICSWVFTSIFIAKVNISSCRDLFY